jgi:S-(hydroxymethyl)glutathione dehydrogenase/alcohol dehydrogenase
MKAALLREYGGSLTIEHVAVQEPQEGEVLVRVAASGICGSDVHARHGRSNAKSDFPIILGHEGAGVVEAVGPGVDDLAKGDSVIISMSGPCGRCSYCGTGRLQYCDAAPPNSLVGVMADGTMRLSQDGRPVYPFVGLGTFAEYVVIPRAKAAKVVGEAPFESLCLAACGVQTGLGAVFNVAKVTPGSSVLVIGCGGVGLSIIQGARIAGAGKVIAVDTKSNKLDLASDFGASHCVLSPPDAEALDAEVRKIVPKGVDFAFDAVGGSPERISQLMALTDMGGLTVLVGVMPWTQVIGGPAGLMMLGERRLTGVRGGSAMPQRDLGRIVDLYRNGRLKLDEMVGRTYALDDIETAFEEAERADAARTVLRIAPDLL